MTETTFTSEEDLRAAYFDSDTFAHRVLQNAIHMGSKADADGNQTVTESELLTILQNTNTKKDDYCTHSGNAERYPETERLFINLQIAGADPQSEQGKRAIDEVSAHLLGLVKEKMNGLERLTAPSAAAFREDIAKALQDPVLRQASQKIVLSRSFEPDAICPSAKVEKASNERRR